VMLNNAPLRMPQVVVVDVGVAIVVVLVTVVVEEEVILAVEEEGILAAAEVEATLAAEEEVIILGAIHLILKVIAVDEEAAAETVADVEVGVAAIKMAQTEEAAAAAFEEEEVAIEEAAVASIADVAATAVDEVVSVWGVAPHVAPHVAPPLSTVFSTVNHNLNWFRICRQLPPLPLQPHLQPRIRTGLTKIPMPTLRLTVKPTTTDRRRRRRHHQRTPEPEDGLPPRGASLPALACLMIESINVLADLRREIVYINLLLQRK